MNLPAIPLSFNARTLERKSGGILCPACQGPSAVIYTRTAPGGAIHRRRQCAQCGNRFTTREVFVRDAFKDPLIELLHRARWWFEQLNSEGDSCDFSNSKEFSVQAATLEDDLSVMLTSLGALP